MRELFTKPFFVLGLILFVFLLKGLVFAASLPMFQGPDEYIHYATIQYLAESPEERASAREEERTTSDTKEIASFHYTQEIKAFSSLTESTTLSGKPHNTQNFSQAEIERVENELRSGKYAPIIDISPPDIVRKTQLSHWIGSWLEKVLSDTSVFERYFASRILSVLSGLIVVVSAYFIAYWAGFSQRNALLFAALISFQPMLTATTMSVSYDPLLIAAFSLFFLGATAILAGRHRGWNIGLMLGAALIAIFTKGIGIILLPLIFFPLAWSFRKEMRKISRKKLWGLILGGIASVILLFTIAPSQYTDIFFAFLGSPHKEGQTVLQSLNNYLSGKVFDAGSYERTSVTYWGTFGWLDTTLDEKVVAGILLIEYAGILGLILLFLFRFKAKWLDSFFNRAFKILQARTSSKVADLFEKTRTFLTLHKTFLSENRFLLFSFAAFLLLEFTIRFFDWTGRYTAGEGVGTPGRYFLPTLIPQMFLVINGLGFFVKSERGFSSLLRLLLALMILLLLYALLLVILPRYYF